ncbi:MAG: hypothetical protein IJA67_10590 [Oscillospiraceae bacterium]|nr:hypothetical protein [Oscillospiraceae bacterium]
MIRKMFEDAYTGCAGALYELGRCFGYLGRMLLQFLIYVTVPLWALPYWWYRRRRERK